MRQAVSSVRRFLFSFKGRTGRSRFWIYLLAAPILAFVLISLITTAYLELGREAVDILADGPAEDSPRLANYNRRYVQFVLAARLVLLVSAVVLLWSACAVWAKRWHDRGKSGWWSLINLVPGVGSIWMLVECGLLKGADGPNRYGEDPRGAILVEVFE